MNFFRLREPEYETDMLYSRKNPVKWVDQYHIPGLICPICGPWTDIRRLYLPVNNLEVKEQIMKSPTPLVLEKWRTLANVIKTGLGLNEDFNIQPGDVYGEPIGKITSDQVSDFVFPWRGGILIPEKTRDILDRAKLTGFNVMEVNLVDKRQRNKINRPLPVLYVLIITGRIKPPAMIRRCSVCGRFIDGYQVEPNDKNWDGSDFCIDENYPFKEFISETVCTVLRENKLKNYQCELLKSE